MPTALIRVLRGAALLLGGALAVAGGLALPAAGLVTVALVGVTAGCLRAGIAREVTGGRVAAELAGHTAAWTVGVLLVLAGTAAVAGSAAATLLAAVGGAAAVAIWLVRTARAGGAASPAAFSNGGRPGGRRPSPPVPFGQPLPGTAARGDRPFRPVPPVGVLSTEALGREWVHTTAALAGRLAPAERQSLVARRQEALDELERRDPAGFARWLAAGPLPGSDPAGYVQGDPAAGTDAA